VCFPTRVQDGVEFKGAMPGPGGRIGVFPALSVAGGRWWSLPKWPRMNVKTVAVQKIMVVVVVCERLHCIIVYGNG
jgi:hypothetical protein